MYYRSFYVFDQNGLPVKAVIRNYSEQDFDKLIDIQKECFPPPFPPELWWNKEQLNNHVTLFPEGALCIEVDGRILGSMTGMIIKSPPKGLTHTWEEITDGGYIRTHDPQGDTLYVVDLCVHPSYRKLGLGKCLMQAMYDVVIKNNLARLLGGVRMSGYHQHADRMDAVRYMEAVIQGKLQDPVISFMLRCGRTPVEVVADYLEDEESGNFAVLMEWKNPFTQQ